MDELVRMTGLENVKKEFMCIKNKIETATRQGVDMQNECFHIAFLGNPGTGKTTVARLYAKFLASIKVLPTDIMIETNGSTLIDEGLLECKKKINGMSEDGGAFFVDDAHQLASSTGQRGNAVFDYLLSEADRIAKKVVFIVAGYPKQMEAFFAYNPSVRSKFPKNIEFKDYTDKEILGIFNYSIERRYVNRKMVIEQDSEGLFSRIVARRIGRGRDKEGFGNARQVKNELMRITDRQAKRLQRGREAGHKVDDMLLTQEDLLGPEPANSLSNNDSWNELRQLVGITAVENSVKALFSNVQYNYRRELSEQPLVHFSLNKVFLGNPGTGRTTVAKLYGQIIADIGLLSNGEVVVKTPADFMGGVLGASEASTKSILASTLGKVLVIDEAFGLHGGDNTHRTTDMYKTAVIDTIVAEVQRLPEDDRCVILLGYKEQIEEMFQHVNPGLSRRFHLDSVFHFEDFTSAELASIFELKLKRQGFKASDQAKKVACDMLNRARNRPHFSNAREIDVLLNSAKIQHQQRISEDSLNGAVATFEAKDFDLDFDRRQRATENLSKLFEGFISYQEITDKVRSYQRTFANFSSRNMDPYEHIPFTFIFRGPPGTGKTSTARRMGEVYYDMGCLSTTEVIEVSATALIGQYVGQTGPKVQSLLQRALGKVLFIDKAYRLADGAFAKEAIDELVDCLTKPRFSQKMVIILAGYDAEINRLMMSNPGLSSRFPETLTFESMKPEDSVKLLAQCLDKREKVDATILKQPPKEFHEKLLILFESLRALPNWASARDIQTIARMVLVRVANSDTPPTDMLRVKEDDVLKMVKEKLEEKVKRGKSGSSSTDVLKDSLPTATADFKLDKEPPSHTDTATPVENDQANALLAPPKIEKDETETRKENKRDFGVSDSDWEQLQRDQRKAERTEQEYERLKDRIRGLRHQIDVQGDDSDDSRATLMEIEANLAKMEEERDHEKKKAEILQHMGRCQYSYQWTKQSGGYRCEGGLHWVSDREVEARVNL